MLVVNDVADASFGSTASLSVAMGATSGLSNKRIHDLLNKGARSKELRTDRILALLFFPRAKPGRSRRSAAPQKWTDPKSAFMPGG
jgi:hypothetical protein